MTTKEITALLQEYLNRHYITREELLALLGLGNIELERAIDNGMLPACSYRVQNGICSTAVFGEQPAPDCRDGEYFPPSVSAWYRRSQRLLTGVTKGGQRPIELIGRDFVAGYIQSARSSADFRSAYGPLLDAPADALGKMAQDTWGHHRRGTYGVCVISPDSFEKIQSKQAAVKKLASFTRDGTRRRYTGEEKTELLRLVKNYNDVAMPFSPVDYGKSSRKRLVDDILASL